MIRKMTERLLEDFVPFEKMSPCMVLDICRRI